MVPLLKFYFHDTVRVTAAESLPHLLECAKVKGDEYVGQLWTYVLPEILSSIEKEPEDSVIPEMMDSFSKCVETLGSACMPVEQLDHLATIIHDKFEAHAERQKERGDKRKDEDYDDEVEEELQDEHETDEYILSKVSDIMHALFKTHWTTILPFFEKLLPDFHKLLNDMRPGSDRQWSLCIFDDLIEYTGPVSLKYKDYFLQNLLTSVQDPSPEVRQAAAYGCGVMGQFGGQEYAETCAQAVPLLAQVITHPESRTKENVNPTENCISAVTKICKYNSSRINVNEVIPTWLSWLPIKEDQEEAPHACGWLADLVESNNLVVLGENNTNLPHIIKIIAETFECDVLENYKDTADRLKSIALKASQNGDLWNACMALLDEPKQQALTKALAS
jgi:hypothetical protein